MNAAFVPGNSGTYNGTVFDSSYTSNYNSAFATNYNGGAGAIYIAKNAEYLNIGYSAGAADTAAQDWCARLARETAMLAAHAAADADAGTHWITIDAYGAGADPIFDGNSATNDYFFKMPNRGITGGWKVKNCKIKNYKYLGIDVECAGASHMRGIWLENVVLDTIEGGNESTSVPPYAGANIFCPTAISLYRVDTVMIKNVTTINSGIGLLVRGCHDIVWDGGTCSTNSYGGMSWTAMGNGQASQLGDTGVFLQQQRALLNNITMSGNGVKTKTDGTDGIFVFAVTQMSINGCTIDHTTGPSSPDRVALDVERAVFDLTVRSCNTHDNDGSTFLIGNVTVSGSGSSRSGCLVDTCQMVNNATVSPSIQPSIARYDGLGDAWILTNNTITRAVAGTSKLFGDRTNTPASQTDTPPTGWTFFTGGGGGSNTVTN